VRFLTAFLILAVGSLASASTTANLRNGVMLYGYDPVSYFKGIAPTKGESKIKSIDGGMTYYFSNEENKVEFEKNKAKYIPAYEGWCATAVAGGYKYDIDPLNYKITNGRLFLFYKGWLGDAKKDWVKNENEQITKADKQWPTVRTTKE
jgi:YHS domain-containing protein